MGSGVGRLATQCYLETGVPSVGVELSAVRHAKAQEGLARLTAGGAFEELGRDRAGLEFKQGDLVKALPELGASHAYVASLLFGDEFLECVGAALDASDVETGAATTQRRAFEMHFFCAERERACS